MPGSSSLGTSAASSMSDLAIGNHHHSLANNDSLSMFKSGSAASSMGSSSMIPQAPFLSASLQTTYVSGQNALEQNGYSLPTPSTIVDGGSHHQDIAPLSTSFLPNFEQQLNKDEKAMESDDFHDIQVTPRLVSHGASVAVNDVDMHEHVSTENEVLGMGMGPSVEFQIGTPQYQRGSPVEREEEVSYGQDGYLRPHNSMDVQQAAMVQSAVSEVERRELEQKVQVLSSLLVPMHACYRILLINVAH